MKNKKLFAILTLVCFMFTLMPVAAFATTSAEIAEVGAVYTVDENASEKAQNDKSKANLEIAFDFDGVVSTTNVFVWFVKDGSNVPAASAIAGDDTVWKSTTIPGVFTGDAEEGKTYKFAFPNSGEYKVYASLTAPVKVNNTTADAIADVENKLGSVSGHQSFEITSTSSSSDYAIELTTPDGNSVTLKDGGETTIYAEANNVMSADYVLKLVDTTNGDKAVKGETITLDTNSSNIELNKDEATTDQLGKIKFKVAGVRNGEYKIYVKVGSYESTIIVKVGATGAYDIELVKSPSAPIDVTDDLGNKIQFALSDANGNAVKVSGTNSIINGNIGGADNAFHMTGYEAGYVSIVSQPAASDLENEDFYLGKATKNNNEYRANLMLASGADDLIEGTYEIKVVLDNGKYATVTFEVKEFATPVALNLVYDADAVEIGSVVAVDTLEWVDANGVTKDATGKVDLAATGYAVEDFDTNDGTIAVKSDDKYVGSTITVVAVDDRYNLTATATIRVADEATALAFDSKTLAVDTNNYVGVSVVDSEGNKVALNKTTGSAVAVISYVVLDKPEDAKVSVTTVESQNKILDEGTFQMNVTSNTVGNVTIQAVAKVTYTNANQKDVVKYYTGTQVFAVGTESVGTVVVMSIGSNSIIVNDAVATIDAAPMVENNRTFVPFRALAEAFGATVAYDEATQSVTAELNGTTVVMTIGSATYTVNGVEKTADVAPFINGSRTMVPVRFVAEAFGIKVIPTYDENGATADILFNM